MKIILKFKNKKIIVNAKICNLFEKARGLMFRKKQNSGALLFNFKKPSREPLHSLFVFFPFYVLWIDDKNKILDIKKITPFRFSVRPKVKFSKIVEIPINNKYKGLIKLLDDS